MSKLFDKFRNSARSHLGDGSSAIPNALLSHALRRASDERAALRAASPAGITTPVIDVENVEAAVIEADPTDVARTEAETEAHKRMASAQRERAEAEELALQAAKLGAQAEARATELARERENAALDAQDQAQADRDAASTLEDRLRFEAEFANRPTPQPVFRLAPERSSERERRRRLKRNLVLALLALAVVVGVIFARNYMPELTGEHASAPVFQLEHQLKTPPEKPSK